MLTCLSANDVFASAPPQIIRAAMSSNGEYLVLTNDELGPEGPGGGRPVISTTFEVIRREPIGNSNDRLPGPNNSYYSALSWKVVLPAQSGLIEARPIVSGDGQTLVLVSISAAVDHQTLLAIYRKQQSAGVLVRMYKKADILRRLPNEPSIVVVWDSTPAWFATGCFTFSKDSSTLFYSDPRHGRVAIRLADGAITRQVR